MILFRHAYSYLPFFSKTSSYSFFSTSVVFTASSLSSHSLTKFNSSLHLSSFCVEKKKCYRAKSISRATKQNQWVSEGVWDPMSETLPNPDSSTATDRSVRSVFGNFRQLFSSCSFMRRKSSGVPIDDKLQQLHQQFSTENEEYGGLSLGNWGILICTGKPSPAHLQPSHNYRFFCSRSRRSKERTATTGTGGAAVASAADRMSKRVASASLAVRPQAKSSDLMCVCDSIDGNVSWIVELIGNLKTRIINLLKVVVSWIRNAEIWQFQFVIFLSCEKIPFFLTILNFSRCTKLC